MNNGTPGDQALTFEGITVPVLPSVRTSDGHIIEWDRNRIVRQIVEETKLVETFYGYEGADEATAQDIAHDVENRIKNMGLKSLFRAAYPRNREYHAA